MTLQSCCRFGKNECVEGLKLEQPDAAAACLSTEHQVPNYTGLSHQNLILASCYCAGMASVTKATGALSLFPHQGNALQCS